MHFHLDELQTGKEVQHELNLEREEIQTRSGVIIVQNLKAQLRFRMDPLGYVVKYTVRADAQCDCTRCGQSLQLEVDTEDWLALRVQQPEENLILLDNSEMNVRFIADKNVDLQSLVLEAVDLALPSFPRHEDDSSECLSEEAATGSEEPKSSPFDVLSKYL